MSDVLAEIRYVAVKSVCSLCVSSVSISFSHISAYVVSACCSFHLLFICILLYQSCFELGHISKGEAVGYIVVDHT